jgi:hypothetical protein
MTSSSNTEPQSPSVEELVTAFKRRGHFDTLRKSTLSSFQGGVCRSPFFCLNAQVEGEKLRSTLQEIVRAEVEKDLNLLYRDRSKSSILIGGAVDRYVSLSRSRSLKEFSAGVLDTVKQGRDIAFEEEKMQEQIKKVIAALRTELSQSGPNGNK